jgi:hypothetical protein
MSPAASCRRGGRAQLPPRGRVALRGPGSNGRKSTGYGGGHRRGRRTGHSCDNDARQAAWSGICRARKWRRGGADPAITLLTAGFAPPHGLTTQATSFPIRSYQPFGTYPLFFRPILLGPPFVRACSASRRARSGLRDGRVRWRRGGDGHRCGTSLASTGCAAPPPSHAAEDKADQHSYWRDFDLPLLSSVPLPSLVDMAGRTRARRKKSRYGKAGWEAYWGYLLLLLLIPAWSNVAAGPGLIGPLFVLGLSLTDAFYFLFLSPGTCRAPREDGGRCRNNASGILLGCWIRDHRWERLKLIVRRERWEELGRRLRADARGLLATLGTCATIASGAAAVITLIIKR